MQFEEVQKKITAGVLDTYVQSIQQCASLQDLIAPTKNMLEKVAEIVLPKFRLDYVPVDMPQDILNDEESKDQLTSEQKLVTLIRQLKRSIKTQTVETEQQLVQLLNKRDTTIEFMKSMAQKKDIESNSKTFIDFLNSKIAAVKNQTGIIKASEAEIMSKVEKIFEDTTLRMSQAEIVKQQLVTRLANPMQPITKVQDKIYPAESDLKFENQLISIREAGATYPEFNFVFSNGAASQFQNRSPLTENQLQLAGVAVKQIVLWSHSTSPPAHLFKIQLFGKDGSKLLETGFSNKGCTQHETVLEDDERIIGVRGRTHSNGTTDYCDFQFVIGKLV